MYLTQEQLNHKIEKFIQRETKTLDCYSDFHFEGKLIRLPIETKDGNVLEATFCNGYERKQYLVALSPQIGCASRCKFCELGDYGLIRDLTDEEIVDQAAIVMKKAYERNYPIFNKPLKITFVMGGEPMANKYFGQAFEKISQEIPLKAKISTIFPATERARKSYQEIVDVAKNYLNVVQFQISLNATNEKYRQELAVIPLAGFKEIRQAGEKWFEQVPNPRKIDLTFTINQETPLNPQEISDVLTPDLFAIRLRSWVPTQRGKNHGLETILKEKFEEAKKKFEDVGYTHIPGDAGGIEYRFKLAPGETLKIYSQLRNKTA